MKLGAGDKIRLILVAIKLLVVWLGCVKLRKIYKLNYKILLKLSTEHNRKVEHTYYLKLTGPMIIG